MYYPVGHNRSLMIILLVAYIIQVDRCSADDPSPPAADPSPPAADATTAATDPTATDPTATDPTAAAANQRPSTFSHCKRLVYKTISDMSVGAGMVLKAIGHAALAVMSALFGTYDGVVLTAAATGETVAGGIDSVNNMTGEVVLVGDVTTGAANLATEMATMYRNNAEHNTENHQLLVDGLESRVDNYHPESKTYLVPPVANEAGEEVKTAAIAAAAA